MKKDFLLEVLVQELPYKFIPSAIAQLKSSVEKLFNENGLSYGKIEVLATPRRLAVLVDDLTLEQETVVKDVKGPILTIAKKDGEFSPAAIGFAKKNGVELTDLYEKDDYIWAKIEIKGNSAVDVIKNNAESLILKLQGAHFMRWGYNSEKFSRPIENVVAILGDDLINLEIMGVKSTKTTQGHRYSLNREVTINNKNEYVEKLRSANVIVNQDERKELIIDLAKKCAAENNLEIKFDDMDELLEEVTFIL